MSKSSSWRVWGQRPGQLYGLIIIIKRVEVRRIKIKIPATTTNLGSGFDCLGLALNLYNEIEVRKHHCLEINLDEKDIGHIPTDNRNLIVQAMQKTFDTQGILMPNVWIKQTNRIPMTRGLGSSAACIVGGIIAANRLMDDPLSIADMLKIAVAMDGHPDNVVPAFTGGLIVAVMDEDAVKYTQLNVHHKYRFIFIVPNYELSTKKARSVLPNHYSQSDTVSAIGHAALMAVSLQSGDAHNLQLACDDTLHQPYRLPLMNTFEDIRQKVYDLGADGVFLSGAGPTIGVVMSTSTDQMMLALREFLPKGYAIIQANVTANGARITSL